MLRAFLPDMKKRNDGHIVATSSVAAYTCTANIVPYAATKYGVTGEPTIYIIYYYITSTTEWLLDSQRLVKNLN